MVSDNHFRPKEFGMAKPRIAIIVGSNRRDSINRKLAHALAKLGADKFDARNVRRR
jgi:chromate reductase, NAD(P)H dehydrogenase (quinone)